MSISNSQPEEPSAPSVVAEGERTLEIPGIDDIDELKSLARSMLQRGSVDFEGVMESLPDYFGAGEDSIPGVTDIAESVLRVLISEQTQWPEDEMADMKMLKEAFKTLEWKGVISRTDYSCCSRCGNGEIKGDASTYHVGYCYFHEQDLDGCIEGYGLVLRHGVIGDDIEDLGKRVENAKIIVEAMKDAGLQTEWNEDAGRAIRLPGFKWRIRLHDSTHEGDEQEEEESRNDEDILTFPSLDFYVR
ncbi:hypothetical protein ACLOAV_005901 [Pseudogymnoascus australis]